MKRGNDYSRVWLVLISRVFTLIVGKKAPLFQEKISVQLESHLLYITAEYNHHSHVIIFSGYGHVSFFRGRDKQIKTIASVSQLSHIRFSVPALFYYFSWSCCNTFSIMVTNQL